MYMKRDPNNPDTQRRGFIMAFLRVARSAAETLPFLDLLPGEGPLLSHYMVGDTRSLVFLLVHALRLDPDLFPGAERLADRLCGHQERALLWLEVIHTLESWLHRAQNSYVKEQAAAVKPVIALVQRVVAEEQLWREGLSEDDWDHPEWVQKELLPRMYRNQALIPLCEALEKRRALYGTRKPAASADAIQNGPKKKHDGKGSFVRKNVLVCSATPSCSTGPSCSAPSAHTRR